jgi:hypothetical protein
MIRCDNDECPLSRECFRFLMYPTESDGVDAFKPKSDKECDHFIELAQYPDNNN